MQRSLNFLALIFTGTVFNLLAPEYVQAQADVSALLDKNTLDRAPPGREMLEFLAEFGDTDDETFELIVFHAKEDFKKTDVPTTNHKPTTDKEQNNDI